MAERVDTLNPTGYAQVVYEAFTGGTAGTYQASFNSTTQRIYYVYDGHGSVRALTDPTGAVTDTYDYDAFGNLIRSSTTLSTPTLNNYLFAGEQFDPDLNLYYNRARYLNVSTGRFWSMDTYEGDDNDPSSLHKYLYSEDDAVNNADPTGNQIDDVLGSLDVSNTLDAFSTLNYNPFEQTYRTATTVSYRGIEFIKLQEGLKTRPYNDQPPNSGNCTIGYGHLIHLGVCTTEDYSQYPAGISPDAAEQLLFTDVYDIAVFPIKFLVTVPLAQKEFDALTDFTFNLGSGLSATSLAQRRGLASTTLLRVLNLGFYSAVPAEFSKFTFSGGVRLPGLVRRRDDEANLWVSGIYRSNGTLIP